MMHVASRRYGAKLVLSSVLACAVFGVTFLAGCTDPATRAQIDQQTQDARAGMNEALRPPIPSKRYNPLVVSDKVWTGNTALRMHRGIPLPAKFETPRGVTIVSADPLSLKEIVNELAQKTGIPFHVADGSVRSSSSAAPAASASAGATPTATTPTSSSAGGDGMPITYEGPLSGLLERVSGHFGINWKYDGSTISITRFETRVFAIEALPGKLKVSEGMQDDSSSSSGGGGGGGSGGGGGGGGGSGGQNTLTQNSKIDIDFGYWEELEKVINSMLGGTGTAVVSPSLGTVTVTTTQEIMHTIANFLEQENQRISRQIAVNVEIYSVSLSQGLDFNLAFNTALRRLANFSGNFSGASAPTTVSGFTGGGALTLAILNPARGHSQEVTDVFKALSGIGDTTKVAKFPLITLNNRPVARRVGKEVAYVASATSNPATLGGSAGVSLSAGSIHQGFSVQLTPRLLDDGRILLQYSLSIIDVLALDSFNSASGAGGAGTANSSTIQLPTTSNRIFVQQSVLKSGSTLILGGAEEDDAQQNSQGVTDPTNYALGGGLSSGRTHTMVFFALTPQVLDTPHSEQE